MAFKFLELRIFHQAADLSNEIDILAKNFPVEEVFF